MSEIKQAQIEKKDFPECVRIRKGMYISNQNQMVTEIVDNSVDEHFAGFCNAIAVVVKPESIVVQDDGRGIPCTPTLSDPSKTQVEMAFTELHAGGKFGSADGYEGKTGGMNGVGGSCVQALSEWMNIEVASGGKRYLTKFARGFITEHTHVIEENVEDRGTTVEFKMDEEIWKNDDPLNKPALKKRLKQLAYLNPGLLLYYAEMNIENEVFDENRFYFEGGLKDYISDLTASKNNLTDTIYLKHSIADDRFKNGTIDIQVALTYTDSYNDDIYTFCNNMATVDNGDHLTGFKMGLADGIKQYAEQYNISLDCTSDDIREGVTAIVSIKVKDPNFEGQAKTKLKMNSVKNAVKSLTQEAIIEYLDKNPETAKAVLDKVEKAANARKAAQRARELSRSSKNASSGTPEKLADCSSKNPEECEIFIVEGDSAGGSAKQGRDRKFQAILPVFGKITNVEKQRLEEVLNNVKIGEFVKAVKTGIGDEFDIDKLKYFKIIIMSDADVDGYHIACLWLTALWRYMKPLILNGHVYLSCPPRFKMVYGKDNVVYALNDDQRESIIAERGEPKNTFYLKGLGEMNAEQLWETTMNPETRTLIQVTAEDAESAEAAISLCMSKDSKLRKQWVMDNFIYGED